MSELYEALNHILGCFYSAQTSEENSQAFQFEVYSNFQPVDYFHIVVMKPRLLE